MASDCGCRSGFIPNGHVATGNCRVYSYACDIYCSYYCYDGYVKTASSVYCAGNDQWVPTGTHQLSNKAACKRSTASGHDKCEDIFFDHGYIVACPTSQTTSRRECFYHCFNGYKPVSKKVYCTSDEWVDTVNNSTPCIKDGNPTTVRTNRSTTTVFMPTPPTTPYRGYYDDPNLKMDVSPVIFVAAVLGGIIVLALLMFAIFFRAHKKSRREVRRRAAFIDSCDPFSARNDFTNFQDDSVADDSGFRDIARRIIDRSTIQQEQPQQHNVSIPPPYDANSTTNINRTDNETYNGPPSPPYSEVYSSGTPNPDLVPYRSFTQQQISQTDRNTTNPDTVDRTNENTDKPPPYEAIDHEMKNDTSTGFNPTNIPNEEIDPPPPYSVHIGTGSQSFSES